MLQNDARSEGPLQKFFLGETRVHSYLLWVSLLKALACAGADVFAAGYLAEDREMNVI